MNHCSCSEQVLIGNERACASVRPRNTICLVNGQRYALVSGPFITYI